MCNLYIAKAKNRRTVLYVGISLSAIQRLQQHRKESCWFNEAYHIDILKFETKREALDKERELIKSLGPKYNVVHNDKASRYKARELKARLELMEEINRNEEYARKELERMEKERASLELARAHRLKIRYHESKLSEAIENKEFYIKEYCGVDDPDLYNSMLSRFHKQIAKQRTKLKELRCLS